MQEKLLCLSLMLILSGLIITANAQDAKVPGSMSPKPFVVIQKPPQAKLVGRNNNVSFYELPQDRMICLVPNDNNMDPINVWRNNDSIRIQQNIPNRTPRRKIIPDSTKTLIPSTSFRVFRSGGSTGNPYGN